MITVIKAKKNAYYDANTYILTADGKTAVVIDPASENFISELEKRNLKCEYALLTHGHLDHIGGCGALYKNGVKICCGEGEKSFIFSEGNFAIFGEELPEFEIYKTFKDGEKFNLSGIDFTAISTPGHTVGGACYIVDDYLFSGDTLFYHSIGRTDFPTGNFLQLIQSVKKLFSLGKNYTVFCGHEQDTTIDEEIKNNPFIK